jgi:peroxin-14
MATTTAGVCYGLYQVVSKYVLPSVIPPSVSAIEKDKQTIDEEFTKIDKILEQLSEDQAQIKSENEAKLKEIDIVVDNVNDFLSKYNKDKLKFDDDLRLMKLEIDNLSNSIEKNMGFTKNNIKDELGQINEELQSLKQLIKVKQAGSNTAKIAPVSSIPSASEILQRAKAKREEEAKKEEEAKREQEAKREEEAKKNQAQETKPEPKPDSPAPEPQLFGATTKGGVTAAGIPAWQLQHKEEEEKKTQAAPQEPPLQPNANVENPNGQNNTGSIPPWQLNATDENADEKVKETLKNVGVPAWQLNANST